MKFTLNWLFDHLETNLSYFEIAENLTKLGIEVEEILDNNKKFENFVVGFIKKAEKHPNADKLKVCQVDIGDKILNIVCGAKNAREGIYVAVAKVGAFVPAFGEKLKKGVIRGIESQGMMCSCDELLLDNDGTDGIMELSENYAPGTPLASALEFDDIILDVSITPNRADCFSVRGIARDLAALGIGKLLPLKITPVERTFENPIGIELKTSDCPYFSLTAVKGISGQTPNFIKKRLAAIGQKLIFPVVDIANYVCIDVGQPLHIFDMDKIKNRLVIKNSNQGELLETLDGKETTLQNDAVVIYDDSQLLSIAGVKGGESSAFSETTKNILIEGAYFNKVAIAKAGQELRIISDSRTRFERGIDPKAIDENVDYTISLLSSICNCKISKRSFKGEIPSNEKVITLTFEKFNALTNLSIEEFSKSKEILKSLGITIESFDEKSITVKTPSYRHDLEIEEDLIEEILRIIGFEKIADQDLPPVNPITKTYAAEEISKALAFNGFYEVKTFSFIDEKLALAFDQEDKLIKIKDALTTEFSVLRPSVIASHLKSIKNSQNKSQHNAKIFEIGKRFFKDGENVFEENMLTLTMSENKNNRSWRSKLAPVDIFDAKEILEKLFGMLLISARISNNAPKYFHPGRSGSYIIQKDTVIANFGEIHPSLLSKFDIKDPIVCFELFLDKIPEILIKKTKQPLVLSPYQPTSRDFSFIVGKHVSAGDIINVIKKLHIEFIKDISVFDVYESESIGEDKKAVAIEVTMQSEKSTLTEDQIVETSNKISKAISKSLNGILRDQ